MSSLGINDLKIKAKPQNSKEAMRFMGLCSYYRKFIPGISKINAPNLWLITAIGEKTR